MMRWDSQTFLRRLASTVMRVSLWVHKETDLARVWSEMDGFAMEE